MKMPYLRSIFAVAIAAVGLALCHSARASTFSVGGSGNQFIQIHTGSAYDGNDPNGDVNDPVSSIYKACFILSYDPSGSVETTPHTQFFPNRWDFADNDAQYRANGWRYQEFDYTNAHLYAQKFLMPSLRAEKSGSLVLPPPSAASTSASTPLAPAATSRSRTASPQAP